jgi:hypothetical protein
MNGITQEQGELASHRKSQPAGRARGPQAWLHLWEGGAVQLCTPGNCLRHLSWEPSMLLGPQRRLRYKMSSENTQIPRCSLSTGWAVSINCGSGRWVPEWTCMLQWNSLGALGQQAGAHLSAPLTSWRGVPNCYFWRPNPHCRQLWRLGASLREVSCIPLVTTTLPHNGFSFARCRSPTLPSFLPSTPFLHSFPLSIQEPMDFRANPTSLTWWPALVLDTTFPSQSPQHKLEGQSLCEHWGWETWSCSKILSDHSVEALLAGVSSVVSLLNLLEVILRSFLGWLPHLSSVFKATSAGQVFQLSLTSPFRKAFDSVNQRTEQVCQTQCMTWSPCWTWHGQTLTIDRSVSR